jgi:hypothetical protein
MLSTKLINRTDIALYKQISQTVYDDVLNSIIIESQIQDLAPLVGERLFNDLLNNKANYDDLLNGGTYEYREVTYSNYGLKAVLSYYAYARYQMFGGVIDTPFSQIEKLEGAESRPTSDKTKKDLYQMNRDSAFNVWKSVENYLIRTNNELYGVIYLGINQRPIIQSNITIKKIV